MKMGTEDQIHKGDSKYQKAKIKNLEQRLDSQKYIVKIQNKINNKNYKKIYETCLKSGVVFLGKVLVGYTNEN